MCHIQLYIFIEMKAVGSLLFAMIVQQSGLMLCDSSCDILLALSVIIHLHVSREDQLLLVTK